MSRGGRSGRSYLVDDVGGPGTHGCSALSALGISRGEPGEGYGDSPGLWNRTRWSLEIVVDESSTVFSDGSGFSRGSFVTFSCMELLLPDWDTQQGR